MSKDNYLNLPAEKFEFVNTGERITDKKLATKSMSYFADAFSRFRKNKASVIAAIIILLIILFSFVVPIAFNGNHTDKLVSYYAKFPSRIEWCKENLGILDGGREKEHREASLIIEYAKGIGAINVSGYGDGSEVIDVTISDSYDSIYQPVIKLNSVSEIQQGRNITTMYNARIDQYLSYGFIYKYVTPKELADIEAWQAESGKQILYPLINIKNGYCADETNANYWYKTNDKLVPVKQSGFATIPLEFSEDLVLEDNYLRDSKGNLRYKQFAGTDTSEQYKVRILYYNYFQYLYGTTPDYLLGTDVQGYDLANRMAQGIQLSLLLAVCVSVINFIIGAIWGAIAGYYGGTTDLIMERITDILSGIPFIIVATLFQIHLTNTGKVSTIGSLIFAFVLTGWIGTASRVRSQFYRFKNQEYILAARTLGARDRRIIWKHIFPNTLGTIITSSVLVIPGVIFSESMLSFLGIVSLGSAEGTSLGTLLSDASNTKWYYYVHVMFWPALIISLLMICFNLFGNGLRDAFNPSLRGVEE